MLIGFCACRHDEPQRPDRNNPIDRDNTETDIPVSPADSVPAEPVDSVPENPIPDNPPAGSIVPIVGGFDCNPYPSYGSGIYKIECRIENARECGMVAAMLFYGTNPENLKQAVAEFYPNGHIVSTISDMTLSKTTYYYRFRIVMASWYFDTELYSFVTP